jgi:hypothetical protein
VERVGRDSKERKDEQDDGDGAEIEGEQHGLCKGEDGNAGVGHEAGERLEEGGELKGGVQREGEQLGRVDEN